MAEEDQDFHIESADAGASDVIPCEAGAIKKGGYVGNQLVLPAVLKNEYISSVLSFEKVFL